VGEPEAEEDHVIAAVRLPGEEIGLDEPHSLTVGPGRSDSQHLRGRVHGGDVCCVAEKLAGPCAAPAGELKHAARRLEGIQRCGQLLAARDVQVMVVILTGDGLVVGGLLAEDRAELVIVS
jgi:hypothetical protein